MRRAEVSVVSAAVAAALVVSALVGASQNVVQPSTSQPQATRSVAMTFDDLPATRGDLAAMQETTARLLHTLVAERVQATDSLTYT